MVDSDDEDELPVTFEVASVAAAAATCMLDAAATTRQRKRRLGMCGIDFLISVRFRFGF